MDATERLKEDLREGRIDAEKLVELIVSSQRRLDAATRELKAAKRRIAELEKQLGPTASVKVDQPFSMRAEERRQEACGKKRRRKRSADTARPADHGGEGSASRADREGLSQGGRQKRQPTVAHAAGVASGTGSGGAGRVPRPAHINVVNA